METTLVTVRQAAESLGVSKSKVFELLKNGTLERVRLGTRTTRIRADQVRAIADRARQ